MSRLNMDHKSSFSDAELVSKAVIKAARKLDMSNVDLSQVIGVSEPQLSRISKESNLLKKDSKEYELSLLFIQMFRSLDALVGGNETSAVQWMRGGNLAFGQTPLERVKKIEGLVDVLSYLDSRRAPV